MRCSIFENTLDVSSTNYVEVESVLKGIQEGRWREQVDKIRACKTKKDRDILKKTLPAVTFSGTFEQKPVWSNKTSSYNLVSRNDKHLLEYSGLMTIDIDGISVKDLSRIKKLCASDMFLYCCFVSPSGGLKMLYEVDANPEFHNTCSFNQVKDYVEQMYDIEVDKSGKNISRICYVSYDEDMYLNENYVCISVDTEVKEEELAYYPPAENNGEISNDLNYIWEVVRGWLDKKNEYYVNGNRNNYIYKVACILNRVGVAQDQIKYLISSHHNIRKEMKGELDSAVESACKRNRKEFGEKPIYDRRKKNLGIFDND